MKCCGATLGRVHSGYGAHKMTCVPYLIHDVRFEVNGCECNPKYDDKNERGRNELAQKFVGGQSR